MMVYFRNYQPEDQTKMRCNICRRIKLSSRDPWDNFLLNGNFSRTESLTGQIDMESLVDEVTKVYPIVSKLLSALLYENINLYPILHYHGTEVAKGGKYSTLDVMNSSKRSDYITPEDLINKLHIGLKTAARILKATTSQFI